MRTHVEGTIKRVLGPRKSRAGEGLLGGLILDALPRESLKASAFYPDLIFILLDEEYRAGANKILKWKTHRYPEAIKAAETGQRVEMDCTLEHWSNGIGAYVLRPTNIVVADSADDPELVEHLRDVGP